MYCTIYILLFVIIGSYNLAVAPQDHQCSSNEQICLNDADGSGGASSGTTS